LKSSLSGTSMVFLACFWIPFAKTTIFLSFHFKQVFVLAREVHTF
jgi:hypothetical protein